VLAGLIAASAGGYFFGQGRAQTEARWEAMQAVAAHGALRTPEGQRVFKWYLQHPSSVRALMDCNKPGWTKEGTVCYPERDKARQLHGWRFLDNS
jgi:hypothetical protein